VCQSNAEPDEDFICGHSLGNGSTFLKGTLTVHACHAAGLHAVLGKLFASSASYLEEGMSETRAHGRRILCTLAQQLLPQDQIALLLDRLPRAALVNKVEEVGVY
jgi:hypothetical protein